VFNDIIEIMEFCMTRAQNIQPLFNTTCTAHELHETGVWPTGLAGIYEAIRLGELESLRSRKRVKIICAPLRKRLGITETDTET
jgi:hypothetical protein